MRVPDRIDAVYTWVDDAWPGYRDLLRVHAASEHDLNPNRTRDNLELLRYSLRSIATYAPWLRSVYLVTCRPQVPAWLETSEPRLRIVHHDEIIDRELLPTFSSFAILSHLHLLPGLSQRFLYLEDDMLLGTPTTPSDFIDAQGRIRVFPRLGRTAAAALRDDARVSPWNAALALANHLLDQRFGAATRRTVNHVPLLVDRDLWQRMIEEWPDAMRHTAMGRFRGVGDVAPEYLYLHYALATGRAIRCPVARTYRDSFYFPLENSRAQMRLQHAAVRLLRPKSIALNDNFGEAPDPRVVSYMKRALERLYPEQSPFEKRSIFSPSSTPRESPAASS